MQHQTSTATLATSILLKVVFLFSVKEKLKQWWKIVNVHNWIIRLLSTHWTASTVDTHSPVTKCKQIPAGKFWNLVSLSSWMKSVTQKSYWLTVVLKMIFSKKLYMVVLSIYFGPFNVFILFNGSQQYDKTSLFPRSQHRIWFGNRFLRCYIFSQMQRRRIIPVF